MASQERIHKEASNPLGYVLPLHPNIISTIHRRFDRATDWKSPVVVVDSPEVVTRMVLREEPKLTRNTPNYTRDEAVANLMRNKRGNRQRPVPSEFLEDFLTDDALVHVLKTSRNLEVVRQDEIVVGPLHGMAAVLEPLQGSYLDTGDEISGDDSFAVTVFENATYGNALMSDERKNDLLVRYGTVPLSDRHIFFQGVVTEGEKPVFTYVPINAVTQKHVEDQNIPSQLRNAYDYLVKVPDGHPTTFFNMLLSRGVQPRR